MESDYLLGVYDEHRMGAIRFKTDPKGAFLDDNGEYATPPWTSIREIEKASLEIEKSGAEKNPNYKKWLAMLVAPGGSLGGARPKASVLDENKHPWIAKFPSLHDDKDIGAWEMVAYKLAQDAKVEMSEAKISKFNSKYNTFLSKRFDRKNSGKRIHFSSAMTLLHRTDGDDASIGASYLELAEFIMHHGEAVQEDLEQLWRRIVFFICISNVDDHLRNHGFIFKAGSGWLLSPAFDVNAVADGEGLMLNISESDNAQDLGLALDVADIFRIKSSRAKEIIKEVTKSVKKWRKVAGAVGISVSEQNHMERAFRIVE